MVGRTAQSHIITLKRMTPRISKPEVTSGVTFGLCSSPKLTVWVNNWRMVDPKGQKSYYKSEHASAKEFAQNGSDLKVTSGLC